MMAGDEWNETPADPYAAPGANGAAGNSAHVDESDQAPAEPQSPPQTPLDIVQRWRSGGPLVRVPTGIAPLDELCRGGFPMPWRVIIIGAPSAGKTFFAIVVVYLLASGQVCVGILAVDEEPDDVTVRLAQIAGFTVAQAELRSPDVLDRIASALESLDLMMYDATWTIELAADDLATRAKAKGKRAAFFIDSIHAVKCAASTSMETDSVRLLIQANVDAMRTVTGEHRMLVVATGEANRASYRNEEAADHMTDLASGAESRAVEFVSQTLLMLRTPKGHPEIIHVRVPKNRRASKGEFWLALDHERHTLKECGNPEQPSSKGQSARERARQQAQDVARKEKEYRDSVRAVAKGLAKDARDAADVECARDVLGEMQGAKYERIKVEVMGRTGGGKTRAEVAIARARTIGEALAALFRSTAATLAKAEMSPKPQQAPGGPDNATA